MADRSKLVKMIIKNLGCIGPEEGVLLKLCSFLRINQGIAGNSIPEIKLLQGNEKSSNE